MFSSLKFISKLIDFLLHQVTGHHNKLHVEDDLVLDRHVLNGGIFIPWWQEASTQKARRTNSWAHSVRDY